MPIRNFFDLDLDLEERFNVVLAATSAKEVSCMFLIVSMFGLSRTVSEIHGDFSRKSQNFTTLVVFCAPAEGVPLGIWYQRWGSEN